MKPGALFYLIGFSGLGFLAGFAGKKQTSTPAASSVLAQPVIPRLHLTAARTRSEADTGVLSGHPPLVVVACRSSDTLETLLTLDDASSYGRVALWMAEADEAPIRAYWDARRTGGGVSDPVTALVFLNLTRFDPARVIAETKGTEWERYSRWAWAAHDPEAALADADTAGNDPIFWTAWGIGEFNPDWLRAHLGELPDLAVRAGFTGFQEVGDSGDPLDTLNFLRDHGQPFDRRTFQALVARDPVAAYRWIRENGKPDSMAWDSQGEQKGALTDVMQALATSQPDALKQMAEQAPSGQIKWQMEAALFQQLLQNDPGAALEVAVGTKAPHIAAERLASVGVELAKSDPQTALEIFNRMLAVLPDAMDSMSWIEYPDGGNGGNANKVPGVDEFVARLMQADPEKLLDLTSALNTPFDYRGSTPFTELANKWIGQDLDAYTAWVARQEDEKVRGSATRLAMNYLQQAGRFDEAASQAMGVDSHQRETDLTNLISQWEQSTPGAGTAWLAKAALPDRDKQSIRRSIESMNHHR